MLSFMQDELISKDISSWVVVIDNNSSEHKDYAAHLAENNKENDLHHGIGSASINESGILNGCIYTDVNESRHNLYLKLISAIHNLFDDNAANDYHVKLRLVISYYLFTDGKPLND